MMNNNPISADMKKLGFGLMRLPKCADDPERIDIKQVCEMTDLFMDAGFTYFDTAYVYGDGASEEAAKKALVERYPRDSYTIATKLNAWLYKPDEETVKKQLSISMKRLGVDYVDYYLLHALQPNNQDIYENYGLWDYIREQKKRGLIRHWGFSFHGTPQMLDELLIKNPDAEFVQLQINYADWESANIASRDCYEVARKHGKPIVVMEPIKGGILANPPEKVANLFKEANPEASLASWAIRYAASLGGIMTVLSGMSDIAQMKDNISYMKDFRPLDAKEEEIIKQAQTIFREAGAIPCTACQYCVGGCPAEIRIPEIIRAYNTYKLYNDLDQSKQIYNIATSNGGKVSDCVHCAQCVGACPQHLHIMDHIVEAAKVFD